MKWEIAYYNEDLEEEILALQAGLLARYLRLAELMEVYGADLGEPHTKPLGQGLFELRAKAKEGIARFFYCTVTGKRIIILHCFVKKSQKTPIKELTKARKRMKEVKHHG